VLDFKSIDKKIERQFNCKTALGVKRRVDTFIFELPEEKIASMKGNSFNKFG
jgi:hypothetical protein